MRGLPGWSTQRILDGIRDYYARWWSNHPRTDPPRPRLTGADPQLVAAARGRFGSIIVALRVAGIDDPIRAASPQWMPDTILAALREARREGAISYRSTDMADSRLRNAARWHFGSLRNAAQAAGLRYVREPYGSLGQRRA